ncbi:uncharacterized protein cubi_02749 [Cryptosporidium ubiquitum]|uniref:Uncharacterized protein n=1 Tax=Cryptosporidium ubiquitum TaxID=857276 RepID=A0A1J4MKH4_9CRYT|nr:uncharacterized protein cubi_02749 [Cryptosporidium ubiquitum]OII73947.1 hypothetical protein cubi_02749 [Cryptosporidium ubiquitum]
MSINEKSIKQLLSELVGIQVRNDIKSNDEKSHRNLIKKIEDKIWSTILFKKTNKRTMDDSDYISFLDSSLSNIIVQSHVGPESVENMNMIMEQRSKVIENRMFCFLPLFILSHNLVRHYYQSSSGICILQIMYILFGSLDYCSLDFWQDQSLVKTYQSDFTWRLNSIMQRNLSDSVTNYEKDNEELKFDYKTCLVTFSSLIFKNSAFSKSSRDFWLDIISDFALGIVTFRNLVSDVHLSVENLFNSELTEYTENFEEIEISKETNKIAQIAFGNDNFSLTDDSITKGTESKISICPKSTISINQNPTYLKTNKNSLLASFMGNSDDELDELEEMEFHLQEKLDGENEVTVDGVEDALEIIDNKQDLIQNKSQILCNNQKSGLPPDMGRKKDTRIVDSQLERRNDKHLNMSSFNYFDGLSKLIKEKKEEFVDENHRICNFSKVKLPSLLKRISGRSQVEYNRKYLGFSWDQQYLSLSRTNKIFNESILSVLTTERIKNCTIVTPDHEIINRDRHIWIKLDSLMKLFQGLDSEEFSLCPRYRRDRKDLSGELLRSYNIFIDQYNISLKLVEEFGELSPWMNHFGQGDKFIYIGTGRKTNDFSASQSEFRNLYNGQDEQIYLSEDLVSMICLFGTKINYLRSFAELLALLGDKMNSELKSGTIWKNEYPTCSQTIREESMVSIRILSKTILELLCMYLRDIELCFARLNNSRNGQITHKNSPSNSYLNITVLLAEFSPAFEMLARIFKLRSPYSRSENEIWNIPHGYFLLSYIYTYLWQFQINTSCTIKSNHHSNINNKKGINNKIDKGNYSNGHILSVIYKNLLKGIFKCKLDSIKSNKEEGNLEIDLKVNLALNKSILRSIIPVLFRILIIKKIHFTETFKVINQDLKCMSLVKTNEFSEKNLSIFFSDTNTFTQDFVLNYRDDIYLDSEAEFRDQDLEIKEVSTVTVKNFTEENTLRFSQEAIVEYLRRNELDFNQVYGIYFKYLDQTFEQITKLEYNINKYLDLAFEIGELIGEKDPERKDHNVEILPLGLFEFLKEVIQNKVKNKKLISTGRYGILGLGEIGIENLMWRENCNTAYTKQLNNYISVNGDLKYENLMRFVFGLDLNLIQFRKEIIREEISNTFEIQKVGKEQGEDDLLRLFQMIVLLEVISKKFLNMKSFIGRLSLYIWCRKNTTDYNLYLKFSQGYLYDAFSEELQKLIWEIENNINKIHSTIQIIKEYLVMLFRRLDPKILLKSQNCYEDKVSYKSCNYDYKWRVVQKYYYGKLFNHLSLNEKGFMYFITSIVCQICLISSDLVSKIDSFKDIPKRPSSFSPNISDDQDPNDSQRNIILEFVNNWKSNNLEEKVSHYFRVYKSLKIYISDNKSIFSTENSHILYYIDS